jgi:hypothetical protein
MRDVSNRVLVGILANGRAQGGRRPIRHVSVELLAILADVATIVLRRCTLRPFISFFFFQEPERRARSAMLSAGPFWSQPIQCVDENSRDVQAHRIARGAQSNTRSSSPARSATRYAARGPTLRHRHANQRATSASSSRHASSTPPWTKLPRFPDLACSCLKHNGAPRQQTCEHRYGTPANFFSTPNRSGKRSGDIQSNSVSRAVADRTEADAAIPG